MPNADQSQNEAELTLGLLRAVHNDNSLTQRSAARELGVALGLVNTYLKRCVKKGLIKVTQAPSSRYVYYLTPKGFAEKSRLTAEFLTQSLSLFRQAQGEYQEILQRCVDRNWTRVALCGVSDLAEIFVLYSRDFPVTVIGVIDSGLSEIDFPHVPVVPSRDTLGDIDAYIITTLKHPQPVYDELVRDVPADRVLTPKLLEIVETTQTGKGRT